MINLDGFFAERYRHPSYIRVPSDAVYVYLKKQEERSLLVDEIKRVAEPGARFIGIELRDEQEDVVEIVETHTSLCLRSLSEVQEKILQGKPKDFYLDASGLNVRLLGPLLKSSLAMTFRSGKSVFVTYAEPARYKVQKFKEEGQYYDLAEKIKGIYPVAGFECIGPTFGDPILIPMLGFEGGRFAHILSQTEFVDGGIYPVIGVSGYRPEYPFVTYDGNRRPLKECEAWEHIQYAMAGSIVDAFRKLVLIRERYAGKNVTLKIAPIGTKPHAIAALLFACCFPRETELVYDNPIRKKKRTEGVDVISVTCVSDLVKPYYDS